MTSKEFLNNAYLNLSAVLENFGHVVGHFEDAYQDLEGPGLDKDRLVTTVKQITEQLVDLKTLFADRINNLLPKMVTSHDEFSRRASQTTQKICKEQLPKETSQSEAKAT